MSTADDVQASLGRVLAALAKPAAPDDPLEIPSFLRISQEERNALRDAWEGGGTRREWSLDAPKEVTPEVQAELDRQAERKHIKDGVRIGKMKARLHDREAVKAGQRWDARNGRWMKE
jgi:hypothetical protein